jgi:AraC-like DNA-binding protein
VEAVFLTTAASKAHTAETPLRRFNLFRGAGLENLEASSTDWFTSCRVRPLGPTRETSTASVFATTLGPVKLVYAQNSGPQMAVDFTQQEPNYVAMFALDGVNRILVDDEQAVCSAQRATILSPQMVARMNLSGQYAQLHLRIERSALERHLEQMLGRAVTKPIRFRMDMDLTRPALASWMQGVRVLVQDLDEPSGLSAVARGVHPWSDFLMTGLLLAQPHSYSEALGRMAESTFRPQSLKRAVELIEKDPAGDLSLTRICSVAGIGPRALQREFKEYVGTTPREYLQWVRLCRAHDDLMSANGETVTEIALRWGFTHVSRFAAAYRERYGKLPSETLRNSR